MKVSNPLRRLYPDAVFAAGCPSRTVLDHVMSKWGLLVLLASATASRCAGASCAGEPRE